MFNYEKLSKLVADHFSSLILDHQRCSKVRSPLSKCAKCQESCPVGGLYISENGIMLPEACTQCGLCAGACPTEAIAIKGPSEEELASKADKLVSQQQLVQLVCDPAKPKQYSGLTVSCLGSLSPEAYMYLDWLAVPVEVLYREQQCATCQHGVGGAQFWKHLKASGWKELGQGTERGVQVVGELTTTPQVESPTQPINMERRQWLAGIFGSFKKIPNLAVDTVTSTIQEEFLGEDKKLLVSAPGRRQLVEKVLQKSELGEDEEHPRIYLPQLIAPCYLCRACSLLCPTQALSYNQGTNELLLNPSYCSGCGSCAQVCMYKSLDMGPGKVGQVLTGEPLVLAKGIEQPCPKCNNDFISSHQLEQCHFCANKKGSIFQDF